MGRGKTPHGLVPYARARRIAYEKRKNGLMKKAREFSVLCGVDTCVVVIPEASAGPTALEIWPPDSGEASRIVERYISGASRHAFADRKKKQPDLGGEGEGEVSREPSESQLLLSFLGDGVDLAKRTVAAMKEEKRIAMAGAASGPCNEGPPSVEAMPQKTPHQACAASMPDWVAGAQPYNGHFDDGCWDTLAMEDDSTFFRTFLTEAPVF